MKNYNALGDTPLPLLYKECDRKFPDSKFILTTRNKKEWIQSMKWMFRHGRVIWQWPLSLNVYLNKVYGTAWYNEKKLTRTFDKYHKEVYEYFSSRENQLLVVDIDNGFDLKKICDF